MGSLTDSDVLRVLFPVLENLCIIVILKSINLHPKVSSSVGELRLDFTMDGCRD